MPKFEAPWGWSKLDTFRKCKKQFEYQYIQKLPQPGNDAMARGNEMHETIEAYLQGWIVDLPPELAEWKEAFDALKTSNFTAEQAIGLDNHWNVLPDWFDKRTWLRAKMDAKILKDKDTLRVIDFKSGKYRIPSEDQVELYAIVGYAMHPEVKTVKAEFWFIDQNDSYMREYSAEELERLKTKYEKAAEALYNTEVWVENPSRECKWCTYSKSKGGPCKF
jgi:CRISPR/Cas system-associated exonuclease Cas4 (RecB family)